MVRTYIFYNFRAASASRAVLPDNDNFWVSSLIFLCGPFITKLKLILLKHSIQRLNIWKTISPGVSLTVCFVVYPTRRFVLSLALYHFILVFFSLFSITITSPGEERGNLNAFRTFGRFALVWFYRFLLRVWVGLRLEIVIVTLPDLLSYLVVY